MKYLEKIRRDFPILKEKINGHPLIYFDNAASTQKPQVMMNALQDYYSKHYANIHRGVHYLSQWGTEAYEKVRIKIQKYINAKDPEEIIFTKGTTESINLVAHSFGSLLKEGDEILISAMEHHANIVPWQMLCQRQKTVLKVIPIDPNGEIVWADFLHLVTAKTKLLAITHLSNALGTVNPIEKMIALAQEKGAKVLIDAAQSVVHFPLDVQKLNADFLVFSAHKMYGPTGVGVLYAKKELLNQMPPYQGGGDMIEKVTFDKTTYNQVPFKFEAGTPNIADVIAFGASLDYFLDLKLSEIQQHEHILLQALTAGLKQVEGLKIIGNAKEKSSLVSFWIDQIHPYDIGTLLDQMGIAVRTGHHCAQPIMDFFKISGTVRVSFAFYNTLEEVEIFIKSLQKVLKMLR